MADNNWINQQRALLKKLQQQQLSSAVSVQTTNHQPIAIIGIQGFLPQAMSVTEFWNNLDAEKSGISEIPADRFDWQQYYQADINSSHRLSTKWGGFIPNIRQFDPNYFGILPSEAVLMDPQQRMLLRSVDLLMEDAALSTSLKESKTGVYIALEDNEYLRYLQKLKVDLGLNILNHHPAMAANRISYFLDVRGPSEIVNTMCSSGAVAIHNAVTALNAGDITHAIVGGARIILLPEPLIALSRLNLLSKSNMAKSFAADADGYVRSEGVASILLKPLDQAIKEGNHIYAVIRNSAVNYNGRGGISIAAPNRESHKELIKQCYRNAGIDIRNLNYIEAQGMGNPLSDLIEWESFNSAIQELHSEQNTSFEPGACAISSIKPLLGHMECVSAFGALFKIIHSFQQNRLYRISNLTQINPALITENRPCKLLTENQLWPEHDKPRLAGLHSFGSGGNNAHLLIEEFKTATPNIKGMRVNNQNINLTDCWVKPQITESETVTVSNMTLKKSKRICVIGAGPAGLVMAKSLLEEGHVPVIYEKQTTLGGLWVLNKQKSAGAYKKTRFQSSKFTSVFSDFNVEEITSNFYSVEEVKEYLDRYASHFKLNELIHYQAEVISVIEREKQWHVSIRKANETHTEIFDGVALCQGSFWQAFTPEKKGIAHFKGKIMHSAEYFDNTLFKGKRVLVVGNGVSAMDIAEEAASVAKAVLWSKRSAKLILPRMVGFVPNDCQSPASLLVESRRTSIIDRLRKSMPSYIALCERSGLLPTPEEFTNNPIVHINDAVVKLVSDNKIQVQGDIDEFKEHSVVMVDGSEHQIDIVVFCTGYSNFGTDDKRYQFLKNISISKDFSLGIFYAKNTSLVNTSVLPIAYTGSFYFMEMVARWYSQMLNDKYQLTQDELNNRITPDNYLIMAPISSVLFGLRLGLFPKPEREFKEFWRLLNYPMFPMIYRLRGAHQSEQAAAELNKSLQKSFVSNEHHSQELSEIKIRILAGLKLNDLEWLLEHDEISQKDFDTVNLQQHTPIKLEWQMQYINSSKPVHKSNVDSLTQQQFEYSIMSIVAEILQLPVEKINSSQNLSEYGFDSITLTSLASGIQSRYPQLVMPATLFLDYPTLTLLIAHLLQQYMAQNKQSFKSETKNKPKQAMHHSDKLLEILAVGDQSLSPAIWFHGGFGTTQAYLPLVNLLNRQIPFYAIKAHGVSDDSAPLDNLVEIASRYTAILLRKKNLPHFHLGGYSQGGVIAYEVARQLQLAGKKVKTLMMIDAPFPPIISYVTEWSLLCLTLQNILSVNKLTTWSFLTLQKLQNIPQNQYAIAMAKYGIEQGLPYSEDQLLTVLRKFSSILNANMLAMANYIPTLLPKANEIDVYYFERSKANLFFQEAIGIGIDIKLQNKFYATNNCRRRWQTLLPNFKVIATTAENHFTFFENDLVLKRIAKLCNDLLLQPLTVERDN